MGTGHRSKRRRRVTADPSSEAHGSEATPLAFPVGAEVEVRIDDPDFADSFYEAAVAAHLPACAGYEVLYDTLEDDDDGEPLRERAAAANLRPRPPPAQAQETKGACFQVHEMVEAFYNGGWWSGVVSAVPPPGLDRRRRRAYRVAFPTSREVMDFEEEDLRPHQVFRDGSWVPAAEVGNRSTLFKVGSQVEVSWFAEKYGKSWNQATILKVICATNFVVKHRGEDMELITEILDSQYIRPGRSSNRMDSKYRFPPFSHVEVFHKGGWRPGVIFEIVNRESIKNYVVKLRNEDTHMDSLDFPVVLTVQSTQLRPQFDWDGRKWVRCLKKEPANKGPQLTSQKSPVSVSLASCNGSVEIRDKPGSYVDKKFRNADVESGPTSSFLSASSEKYEVKHESSSYHEEMVKQQNEEEVVTLHKGVLGSEYQLAPTLLPEVAFGNFNNSSLAQSCHAEPTSSRSSTMSSVQQSRQLEAPLSGVFEKPRPFTQGPGLGMQILKRDLGGTEGSQRAVDIFDEPTEESCNLMDCAEQNNTIFGYGTDLSRKGKECFPCQIHDGLEEDAGNTKKGKSVVKTIEEDSTVHGISEEKARHAGVGIDLPSDQTPGLPEMDIVSSIELTPQHDNEGSHESYEMFKAYVTIEESLLSTLSCGPNGLFLVVNGESIMDDKPSYSENLPFVKTPRVWAIIEAMDIFRKMPQRPHFQQLRKHAPEQREEMAIGLMSSFATIADSIMKMKAQDDDAIFQQKMEGLSLLEGHGFDVRELRSHLTDLLHLKNNSDELQDTMRMVEEKIAHLEIKE